jgi:hypothetical protein
VQSEVRVTPGEIKTKTPRIPRISRICQKTLDQVLGPTCLSTASSLEIKARTTPIAEHHAQALHYLTATGLRLALLLNFGTRSVQFKRIIRQAF